MSSVEVDVNVRAWGRQRPGNIWECLLSREGSDQHSLGTTLCQVFQALASTGARRSHSRTQRGLNKPSSASCCPAALVLQGALCIPFPLYPRKPFSMNTYFLYAQGAQRAQPGRCLDLPRVHRAEASGQHPSTRVFLHRSEPVGPAPSGGALRPEAAARSRRRGWTQATTARSWEGVLRDILGAGRRRVFKHGPAAGEVSGVGSPAACPAPVPATARETGFLGQTTLLLSFC